MTAGSILSRFLGAVYIIPWGIWFGNYFFRANALYGLGYNIYSFFLIAAIAGFLQQLPSRLRIIMPLMSMVSACGYTSVG